MFTPILHFHDAKALQSLVVVMAILSVVRTYLQPSRPRGGKERTKDLSLTR